MTINKEEIQKDFKRFIRHEAMRANITQEEVMKICNISLGLKL
jgi:hypothetical protein